MTGAALDLGSARDAAGVRLAAAQVRSRITSDGSQVVLDGTIKAQAAAGQRGGVLLARHCHVAEFRGAEPAPERGRLLEIARLPHPLPAT